MNTLQNWAHLCVDMQSRFADETQWHVPWLNRILPAVEELVAMVADALFGSAVPTDDAMLEIYRSRVETQLAMTSVDELHQLWREGGL